MEELDLFSWECVPPPANAAEIYSPRTGHVVITHNGRFYLFGGTDGSARQADVWCFDPPTAIWAPIRASGTVPAARSGAQAVVYADRVWFFGGYTRKDGEYFNDVYSFDLRTHHWEPVATIGEAPSRRTDHSVVLYGRCMYVYGGFDGRNRYCSMGPVVWFDRVIAG